MLAGRRRRRAWAAGARENEPCYGHRQAAARRVLCAGWCWGKRQCLSAERLSSARLWPVNGVHQSAFGDCHHTSLRITVRESANRDRIRLEGVTDFAIFVISK